MRIFIILSLLFSSVSFAQVTDSIAQIERTVTVNDDFYREDQIYFGITHSLLQNTPTNFKQNSISTGVMLGFLRDIPLNKQRNISIAPGAGIAFFNLRNNLTYNSIENSYLVDYNYDKNFQNLTYLEIPLEIRWRTSNKYSHKFWRIYTGVKFSYLLNNVSKYNGIMGKYELKSNPDYNKSNIGAYVSAGFNTWNIYAYYGFNSLYKQDKLPDNKGINFFNVGLMFYIL